MTEEIKTNMDDAKDFASQVRLEAKKQTRTAEVSATKGLMAAADTLGIAHEHNKADVLAIEARTAALNAGDTAKQVGLEVQKQSRDAKLSFDQTAAGQKINAAAAATADAASSALESAKEAVLPSEKVIEQTSTRGVDITSVQNPRNEQIPAERAAAAAKEAAAADREKELERQRMLASAKASFAEKTETASAVLRQVADKAEIVLGRAAVSAKEALDGYTHKDTKPVLQVENKTSASGVDISSVSNAHNDELLAREQRLAELEAAKQPTLGDKLTASLSKAADAIKGAYVEATTDAPAPVVKAKTSESGIDISSAANPANAQLAAQEQQRLAEQKARETAREKALVEQQVKDGLVDPAAAKAGVVQEDLSAKMSALGQSISEAAHKLGGQIADKYQELVNPVPVDVHEKSSSNGIDTTSIANANNHVLGEQIKAQQQLGGLGAVIAPTKEQAIAQQSGLSTSAAAGVAPDRETALIKGGLDGGVAVSQGKRDLHSSAHNAKVGLQSGATNLKDELILAAHDIKSDFQSGAADLQQRAHVAGEKLSAKVEASLPPTSGATIPASSTRIA